MQLVWQFVLYAPAFQLPMALALAILIVVNSVRVSTFGSVARTGLASTLLWCLLMVWLWEADSSPQQILATGITVLFVVGIEAGALLGLEANGTRRGLRIAAAVVVAAVAVFAAPIVAIMAACTLGPCH